MSFLLAVALGSAPALDSDRAGLWQAFEASRHAVVAVAAGFEARNPGQAWRTRFDGRGFTVEPDTQGWSWGLTLERYGFAGALHAVSAPRQVSADGGRVAYDWDGLFEEWWKNDARGLEHGFTLQRRPWSGREEPGMLTLTLAVRGELAPEVQAGGRDVSFVDASGAAVLTYTSLSVLDADGRSLTAGFEHVAEGLLLTIDERGARYPLTIDPVAQQAYLKASNPGVGDNYGFVVAVDGDTAVVGALFEASTATGVDGDQTSNGFLSAGAAYVLVRTGTTWSQQAYLKPSNTAFGDLFGSSVAISGETIVVGAPGEDSAAVGVNGDQASNSASSSGAAYVFLRSQSTWSQQAYLKASNTDPFDAFGTSVAISGDTVVVGSRGEASAATGVNGDQSSNDALLSGAAYVFVRIGMSWSQSAYLKASNTDLADTFGSSVAVWGDKVVIGAPGEDSAAVGVNGDPSSDGVLSSGAAYVFVPSGSTWTQDAYLKASNTDLDDQFGTAVAVSGDTVLVGALGEDSNARGVNGEQSNNNALGSGAAYVFVRGASGWSQQAYLKSSNTGSFDAFGFSVAVSDESLVVGAPSEDSSAIGPYGEEENDVGFEAGAAYLFTRRRGSWEQAAYLKASNTNPVDHFGQSVSLARDVALIGAPLEDSGASGDQASNSVSDAGAAYAFQICSRATVLFRTAGSNPASYVASPAVLGGTFRATVDNNLAGQTSSLLFAFETPTSFPLAGGQTLLCLDFGSGELFTGGNLYPTSSAGGVDSYTLAIPNLPQLEDALAYTQALQFGHPPFVLSNAQDLTVGAF